ncbi:MAG: hypothetical protein VYA84_13395, partial [Planctomycetota bacterium]|nr:hypothetical protein [Planctomycetota bacterium]
IGNDELMQLIEENSSGPWLVPGTVAENLVHKSGMKTRHKRKNRPLPNSRRKMERRFDRKQMRRLLTDSR